ncbi:F-Box Dna Helicase 1 [Manis pentadactyla]|nr:F-Box Dna Helicase 1 [Manis pentadactyla]
MDIDALGLGCFTRGSSGCVSSGPGGPRTGDREHHCGPGYPGAGAPSARRLCQGGCGCDDEALGCGVGSPEHRCEQPCSRPHQWHRGVPVARCWTAEAKEAF